MKEFIESLDSRYLILLPTAFSAYVLEIEPPAFVPPPIAPLDPSLFCLLFEGLSPSKVTAPPFLPKSAASETKLSYFESCLTCLCYYLEEKEFECKYGCCVCSLAL